MAHCTACSAAASTYCAQDACWLCEGCDRKAHCGPLTASHSRVPPCAVCAERPAEVYCRNDTAYLCSGCSDECHAGLPLKHTIVPAAQAVKEGMTSAAAAAPPAAPEHSACGESSPAPPPAAGAPAGGAAPPAARRISEDSAQRVPEFDAGSVPPALDYELPKGPMDKAALAKSIWGKELDALEIDNTWLDRLDMGFDFADELLGDLPCPTNDAHAPARADDAGMVPGASPPASPTRASLEAQLAMAAPHPPKAALGAAAAAEAAALAALERQTTDEFFAALADDFAVPCLPAGAPAAPVPVAAPVAAQPMQAQPLQPAQPMDGVVPVMGFAAPAPMMYVPAGAALVPQPFAAVPAPAPAAAAAAADKGSKRQRRAAAAAAALRDDDSDDDAFMADDSDDEWRQEDEAAAHGAAGARGAAGRGALAASAASASAAAAAAAAGGAAPNALVDNLTREQRVARYREKRKNRQFRKTIRYASRKAYAEVRPRIKGRFAKKEELEAWRAAERAMAAGAAAAGVPLALPEAAAAAASLAYAFGGAEAPGVVPVM